MGRSNAGLNAGYIRPLPSSRNKTATSTEGEELNLSVWGMDRLRSKKITASRDRDRAAKNQCQRRDRGLVVNCYDVVLCSYLPPTEKALVFDRANTGRNSSQLKG